MSIVLQAQNAEDQALSKKMYLPLAEKMIEKHINDGKIEAEAEVRLYLLVLNLLDKHSKALDVVSGKLGEKLSPVVKGYPTEMLKIQESLKDWPAINVENRKLLRERYVENFSTNVLGKLDFLGYFKLFLDKLA